MNLKLRNQLSEILLKGLVEDTHQGEILELLSAYCRAVRASGTTRVRLKDSSLPNSQALTKLAGFGIFSWNVQGNESDPEVSLLPQFHQDVDYLCERVAVYSGVFSESKKISNLPRDLNWAIRIGALLFNVALYFECHEFLEGFWREGKGEVREFLQGIISMATALYHLERGNRPSAIKLFNDAHRRLEAFGKAHRGLAIEMLLEQTKKIQALVEEGGPVALEHLKQIPPPTIQLQE